MNLSRSATRVLLASVVIGLFGAGWFYHLRSALHGQLDFDDAYMFQRYALNMRHGLGVSWNADGVPTYGMTALLWGAVVVGLSFLPVSLSRSMVVAPAVCAVGALLAMAWAVAGVAVSKTLSMLAVAFAAVATPMFFNLRFSANATNGMETMLGVLLGGLYVGLALRWQRGQMRGEVLGFVGWLFFLTRPESAIAVVLLPVLMFLLMEGVSRTGLLKVLGVFGAAVIVQLAICRLYFGSALPLAFYLKSLHGYAGYIKDWHPALGAWRFVTGCWVYLAIMALCVRRTEWKLVAAFVTPALMTFAYLLTTTQIMGFNSRYYFPYLAFLVVPAVTGLDRRIAELERGMRAAWLPRLSAAHLATAMVVALGCFSVRAEGLALDVDAGIYARAVGYVPAVLETQAAGPLPETEYVSTVKAVSNTLAAPLPKGVTIAASEVGYLSAAAPQADIIDLAGLNDTAIARHGFRMDALLARKPDVIWMPHPDYTLQRGLMLSDASLLAQYDVYADAANFGIAIRKDSAYREQIEERMNLLWKQLYPALPQSEYLVRSASWSGQTYQVRY